MRVLFGLLVGLIGGFAAATWFYGHGGNIIVSGHELFPRAAGAAMAPAAAPATPAAQPRPPSQPGRPRVVVRDVTDEPAPTAPAPAAVAPAPPAPAGPPPAAAAEPPPAAAGKPVTRYEITSDLVILVPRI